MMVREPPSSRLRAAPMNRLAGIQRGRVDTAGQRAPGGGQRQVVGAGEPGDAVQQDHDVAAGFGHALGAFHRQFRHPALLLNRLVEGRREHVALDRAAHLGDFFRALADEHHHQDHFGAVLGDGRGDLAQHRGLAGLGRRNHQPRWPNPMGANRSIMREDSPPCGCSRTIWSSGKMGVSDSKIRREAGFCSSGSSRLMLVARVRP